jgi:hypothetical protein
MIFFKNPEKVTSIMLLTIFPLTYLHKNYFCNINTEKSPDDQKKGKTENGQSLGTKGPGNDDLQQLDNAEEELLVHSGFGFLFRDWLG